MVEGRKTSEQNPTKNTKPQLATNDFIQIALDSTMACVEIKIYWGHYNPFL